MADLQAVVERDPACETFVQPLLFFKGFQVGLPCCRVQQGLVTRAFWLNASSPYVAQCQLLSS